jgi:hypothetical protein
VLGQLPPLRMHAIRAACSACSEAKAKVNEAFSSVERGVLAS